MTTTAGLFDLQVNGFAGVDFNDASLAPERFEHALTAMLATGVTQLLPTLITAREDQLAARFAALDAAVAASPLAQAMVPGYHLEGPFLNPAPGFRGCHPAHAMVAPDIALVDRVRSPLSKPILLVTMAPELPGSMAFIRQARSRAIAVAIGHSDARADTVREAVAAGASVSTHLGNGVAHQMHKFDNTVLAQAVEDALWGCIIADGIHVPPAALRMLTRTKTLQKCILVTDAVAAAAAPAGRYPFAGITVERGVDGTVREHGAPHLAGSSLTMDQGVRNLVRWGLCSFAAAVALGSAHPRAALAQAGAVIDDPGEVVWSDDGRVVQTRLHGRPVFTGSRLDIGLIPM